MRLLREKDYKKQRWICLNKSKVKEISEAAKLLLNLGISVTGLTNPALAVTFGILNSLGNYRSNEKLARMTFVMENLVDLIKDTKSEKEFINEISEGKLEPIFMDFLERTLRKVSLTNSEDKRKRFAYLLDNAYRYQENQFLFDNLDMFSDVLEKLSDYQLKILIAHYNNDIELREKLESENENLYLANLNYLMGLGVLSEKQFLWGEEAGDKGSLVCSELAILFIKFIKEYES